MKSITRAFSTLAFAGTLLASTAAFAATPFDIATKAYRGQIEGIPGYQTLQLRVRTGAITGEDILEAAGVSGSEVDAQRVEGFIRDNDSRK